MSIVTLTLPPAAATFDPVDQAQAWLDHWPAPDTLVDACMAQSEAPPGLEALLSDLGAPALDMLVTPLSARAAVLGAEAGRAFVHHELRMRVPMPPALEPERQVWEGGTTPEWHQGVLVEPKYFSFFQDAPLPVFNPNHRRKWRAHELLHGALRFFWCPALTRFEAYLGARLNELLPVVHWYGLDEIGRPRCARHRAQVLYREYCGDCEAAAVPYWHASEGRPDRDANLRFAEHAHRHLSEEWRACLAELDTGRRHPTPRPRLDASSDAVGYLTSHWPRLTAWSFGAWVERFLVDGVDYFSDLRAYMRHAGVTAQRLVSGVLTCSNERFVRQRARRVLQDVGYRTLLVLEWLEEGSASAERAEAALMPHLDVLAERCLALQVDGNAALETAPLVSALRDTFQRDVVPHVSLPDAVVQGFGGLGIGWSQPETLTGQTRRAMIDVAWPQLVKGWESAAPNAAERHPAESVREALQASVAAPGFDGLGPLATRLRDVWPDVSSEELLEWLDLDAWWSVPPHRDEEAEIFAILPDAWDDVRAGRGELRLHMTLRRTSLSAQVAAALIGSPPCEVAGIRHRGEQRLLPLDNVLSTVINAVAAGTSPSRWLVPALEDALMVLLDNSFVVWCPRPL